mmetsp:Transcript_13105/g.20349  ORF Transcript_13105/g.20349 Transcript_13105/m.20349 type:complete len:201 (-) Transcript_13105:237-839(-)
MGSPRSAAAQTSSRKAVNTRRGVHERKGKKRESVSNVVTSPVKGEDAVQSKTSHDSVKPPSEVPVTQEMQHSIEEALKLNNPDHHTAGHDATIQEAEESKVENSRVEIDNLAASLAQIDNAPTMKPTDEGSKVQSLEVQTTTNQLATPTKAGASQVETSPGDFISAAPEGYRPQSPMSPPLPDKTTEVEAPMIIQRNEPE